MTLLMDAERETKGEAQAEVTRAAQIVTYAEEYRCPCCESLIQPACVRRGPVDDTGRRVTRRISVYCVPCNRAFVAGFTFVDGQLSLATDVCELLGREAEDLRAGVGRIAGDVQAPAVTLAPPVDPVDRQLAEDRADLTKRLAVARAALSGLESADLDLARRQASRRRASPPAGQRAAHFVATFPALGGIPAARGEADGGDGRTLDGETDQRIEAERWDGLS